MQSDMLVTTNERSNSFIEFVDLISDLKEAFTGEFTRVQKRLTDLEQKQLTTEEKEELCEFLRQVKAGAGVVAKQKDICERVEKLESSFKLEKSDKISETKTELETDHKFGSSASCTTANVARGPAHTDSIIDALHTLIRKLEVIVSEMSAVRPRFRSRGQSFAKYRVRTNSQLSSASSGVGLSHEFEDLDYPLSRSGSFAMSPVPPADEDQQTSIECLRARTTSVSIQDSSLNDLVSAMDLATAIKNQMQSNTLN